MQEKSSSKKELFGGNIGGASLSLLLQDESFLFVALEVFSIDGGDANLKILSEDEREVSIT